MIGEKSERKSKVCILQMGYGFPHGTARSSDFLYNAPEFRGDSLPEYQVIEYNPSEKSSFMAHRDWIEIATIIETLYPEVDGFVILMGTDTMAYCASALSFMLQNLAKPVVVTGGAVPLCEVYNDSRRNLIVSMLFACSTQLCEVCIFFNDVLLRGNRTTKHSHTLMHAFRSPNYPPLATLSTCTFKNPDFRYDLLLPPPRGRLLVHKRLEAAISVIKLFPGFPAHTLDCAISSGQLRGVVMECFGSGNAPIKRCQGLRSVLSKALGMGIVVVITSQCVYGPVTLETYEAGRHLIELGVISAKDMTLEAIVMKLSFLLGKNLELQDVVHQMNQNICGEMSCTMSHMKNKL